MKTCKKCKKQVPNNLKICKYCGTDISKVKPNQNNKKTTTNKNAANKNKVVKEQVSKVNKNTVSDKTEVLFTEIELKETLNSTKLKKEEYVNDKTEILDLEEIKEQPKKVTKNNKVKLTNVRKDEIKKQLETFFDEDYENEADNYYILTGKIHDTTKTEKIKKDKETLKDKLSATKNKQNNLKNKNKTKKNKKDVKKIKQDEVEKLTRAQQMYLVKKSLRNKRIKTVLLILIAIALVGYLVYRVYDGYEELGHIITEDNKYDNNVFNMNDVITYKDISYSIIDVDTSVGTQYKKPKEGNIYLIVMIRMENHSEEKYHYSGKYFTMTNSLGEESSKIISPVNASSALYSGNLVVGGSKEASLVFEQPIDDPDLKIQYYDPIDLEEYDKKVEEINKQFEEALDENVETTDDNQSLEENPLTKEDLIAQLEKPKPIFKVKIKVK